MSAVTPSPVAEQVPTTQLTLFDAKGILTDLLEAQKDASRCDNCAGPLGTTSYVCCRFPDNTNKTEHEGHTVCFTCADTLAYIGESASCKPCLVALGGRRSSVKLAGVALRPPTKNTKTNDLLTGYEAAKQRVTDANERDELARVQSQAAQRATAAEEVRKKRDAAALATEAAAKAQAQEMMKEAEAAAKAQAKEVMKAADDHRAAAEEEAQRIAAAAKEAAVEERRRAAADAQAEREKALAESEQLKAEARRVATQTATRPAATTAPTKRKYTALTPEALQEKNEKAKRTRLEKKTKLARVDELEKQNDLLSLKCDALMSIAEQFVPTADLTEFYDAVQDRVKELENGDLELAD